MQLFSFFLAESSRTAILKIQYPPNPAPELRMLGKFEKLDINTTLLSKGPIIFGWDNGGRIAPLYHPLGHTAMYDSISRRHIEIDLEFLTRIGVGGPTPASSNAAHLLAQPKVFRGPLNHDRTQHV